MKYLLIPFRILYKIYYFICFSAFLLLLYPLFQFYLAVPNRYPKAFLTMRLYARLLNTFSLIRLQVTGIHNIPSEGAYIICPNHSSFMDIPCIYAIFKKYFVFTGKKEIEKWPLFHIFYTSGMNILVDRKNRTGAYRAFRRISQEIDKGNPLIIFPEGTISKRAPELTLFKSGAFAMAIEKQIPILPVTFISNWKRLQRGKFFTGKASPGLSSVVIHEPVATNGLTKADVALLLEKVRTIIKAPLLG